METGEQKKRRFRFKLAIKETKLAGPNLCGIREATEGWVTL